MSFKIVWKSTGESLKIEDPSRDFLFPGMRASCPALGPLRPRTLSQQYRVCGSAHCRRKADPPQKHGPYYQLSYSWRRKSRTHFVRAEEFCPDPARGPNYERLRPLTGEWIDSALEVARLEREQRRNELDEKIAAREPNLVTNHGR